MPARKNSDLEFHVGDERGEVTEHFTDFNKAAGFAVSRCCSGGGQVVIDVITWTRAAARKWGGESGEETYDADPDASVHERIVIKAEALGRVA